jgi:type I restriction enzyme, S subunit
MSKKYFFKDIVVNKNGFLRGPFGGDLKKELFVEKGSGTYKVYEQGVVLNSDKNIGRYYISEQDYLKTLHRFSVEDRDFLVSCSGVNMGAIYQLKAPFEKGIINQALLRIRLNKELVDDDYFYYLFKELISRKITSGSGDSTIPNFPGLATVKNIEFDLPDKTVQQKIGKTLSALDSKIELNRRINAELEAMAKTLYDYWFVQFDFPDGDGKPYKSSGGQMEFNKELNREIPHGWEDGTIYDVGELLGGGTPRKNEPSYWNGSIPFFTPTDSQDSVFVIDTEEHITQAGLENCSSRLYPKGTIFITARGTVGTINIASQSMAMNQSCYAIQAKSHVNYYYLHQCCRDLIHFMRAKAGGSVFDSLVSNDFKLTPIVVPVTKTIELFGETCAAWYETILINKKQNQRLTELRDWLLPMLMNGQVKVSDRALEMA